MQHQHRKKFHIKQKLKDEVCKILQLLEMVQNLLYMASKLQASIVWDKVTIVIDGKLLEMQIDAAADWSIMGKDTYDMQFIICPQSGTRSVLKLVQTTFWKTWERCKAWYAIMSKVLRLIWTGCPVIIRKDVNNTRNWLLFTVQDDDQPRLHHEPCWKAKKWKLYFHFEWVGDIQVATFQITQVIVEDIVPKQIYKHNV